MLSKNEILDLFPNNSFVKEVYLDWVDFMDLPISIKSLEMFILDVYFYAKRNTLSKDTIVNKALLKNTNLKWIVTICYKQESEIWKEATLNLSNVFSDFDSLYIPSLKILKQTINEYRRNTESV